MYNYFFSFYFFQNFFPGKIVMILHNLYWLSSQLLCYFFMYNMMACGSIITGKVHCHPVFYSFFFIQCQPRKIRSLSG